MSHVVKPPIRQCGPQKLLPPPTLTSPHLEEVAVHGAPLELVLL
eukprot:CAMPEP_0171244214 /NCGR_PEP_ID=MMETSP0790-20130122/46718_1 /TAXON_ID=2925 /ORGANISM="Alexandrium catenella, Strain OF101" /LENGTH=43 /DNA_ID= /DNA_START= /DNA_END= /DNA_ORIENTATION=